MAQRSVLFHSEKELKIGWAGGESIWKDLGEGEEHDQNILNLKVALNNKNIIKKQKKNMGHGIKQRIHKRVNTNI